MDFIIYLDVDWENDNYKNRQHFLVTELSKQLKGSKFLCVERPLNIFFDPILNTRKFYSRKRRLKYPKKISDNIYLLSPVRLTHEFFEWKLPVFYYTNRYMLKSTINKAVDILGFDRTNIASWISHPFQKDFLKMIEGSLTIYDCYDEYILPGEIMPQRDLMSLEKKVIEHTDIKFFVSDHLFKKKGNYKNCYCVPNATDINHFTTYRKAIPCDIETIKRPIIGFIGAIKNNIDFELIEKLVQKKSNWSFIFVGGIYSIEDKIKCKKIMTKRNIHFIGPRRYEILPDYINSFDICWIPFLTDNRDPLKFYDYIACEKPVVSTKILQLEKFKPFVKMAENVEQMEFFITYELENDEPNLRRARREIAIKNSWKKRAEDIIGLINISIKDKKCNFSII